jgi:hypothetical protein
MVSDQLPGTIRERPGHEPGWPNPMPNELGLRNVTFEVDDLQAILGRLAADGYHLVGGVGQMSATNRGRRARSAGISARQGSVLVICNAGPTSVGGGLTRTLRWESNGRWSIPLEAHLRSAADIDGNGRPQPRMVPYHQDDDPRGGCTRTSRGRHGQTALVHWLRTRCRQSTPGISTGRGRACSDRSGRTVPCPDPPRIAPPDLRGWQSARSVCPCLGRGSVAPVRVRACRSLASPALPCVFPPRPLSVVPGRRPPALRPTPDAAYGNPIVTIRHRLRALGP